ncbi:MAG TPA: hypothetical protein DHU65_07180 [Clostridiales bacterium]|nr:hypothetical protein [Clostridiales bacterium]
MNDSFICHLIKNCKVKRGENPAFIFMLTYYIINIIKNQYKNKKKTYFLPFMHYGKQKISKTAVFLRFLL